jgi:hypothetical protein
MFIWCVDIIYIPLNGRCDKRKNGDNKDGGGCPELDLMKISSLCEKFPHCFKFCNNVSVIRFREKYACDETGLKCDG